MDRPKIYMRRNTQFHFSIYACSDSPLLLEILNRLWARVFPYVFTFAILNQDKTEAMRSHWEMFGAFAERDKKRLTNALRQDLEQAAGIIISCSGAASFRIAKGARGSRPIEPPRRQACREHRRSARGFPGTGSGGSAVAALEYQATRGIAPTRTQRGRLQNMETPSLFRSVAVARESTARSVRSPCRGG